MASWITALCVCAAPRALPPIALPDGPPSPAVIAVAPVKSYGVFAPGEDVAWNAGAATTVPPVAGWSFWAKSRRGALAVFSRDPVPHIGIRMGNGDLWALGTSHVSVTPGQTWTFTAVVAGRQAGATTGLGVVATAADGRVVNWSLGQDETKGTFDWTRASVTVQVPDGVAKLGPRFAGYGGGQLFVADAAFGLGDQPAPLAVPSAPVPPEAPPDLPRVGYDVRDPYGRPCGAGQVLLGGTIRLPDPGPGWYEVRVGHGETPALSSAIVVPQPPSAEPGSNPFGTQASPAGLSQRLGITWDRGLYYNIVTGSHDTLPTDLDAYADAWEKKARGGLPPRQLGVIGIWNEPEGEVKLGRDHTVAQFVGMCRAAKEGISRGDPSLRISVNFINFLWSTSSTYREFVRAGGGPAHDLVDVHPYSMHLYNDPVGPEGPEEDMLVAFITSIRELMRQEGVGEKPIWSTEFGWPTEPGHAWSTTELDQARYIVRSSMLQLAAGVERVNVFRMTNVAHWGAMDGSFGMMRDNGSPKPSMCAYSVLARTVHDLPYRGYVGLGRNVGALVFGRDERSVLALWKIDGDTTVAFGVPDGTRVVELFGRESVAEERVFDGAVGPSPLFVVAPCPARDLCAGLGHELVSAPPLGVFDVGKVSPLDWGLPLVDPPPSVDGDLREWDGPAIELADGEGRRAGVRVALAGDRLFVGASVRGPGIVAANLHEVSRAWDGDGIDICLSTRPEGRMMRAWRAGLDHRILFLPGDRGQGATAVELSPGMNGTVEDAMVHVRLREEGYDLEASVPASAFAGDERLLPGKGLALDVSVNVGDGEHQVARLALHRGQSWFTSYVWGRATVVGR